MLLPEIGEHDGPRGVLAGLAAHAHRAVHVRELALHVATQCVDGQLIRAGIGTPQPGQDMAHLGYRGVVRLQVARIAGEQESALRGLRLEHLLLQLLQGRPGLGLPRHLAQRR